ncbi:MAG: HEAT repeat domain-containing protein, partial [Myxococcota bacterium]|nr:HEAT repeat domain-containing protein [Myxococcota bacterium]
MPSTIGMQNAAVFPVPDELPNSEALISNQRPEVEELLLSLLVVETAEDRRLAAQLIGVRRDVNATAGLCVAAKDKDGSVRVQAVKSLGELRDQGAADALINAMKDRSAQVRHMAVQAAGKIGSTVVVANVVELLRDSKEQVQAAAAGTL